MNEVTTKIEEAQKAGETAGAEAGNRMHQEVYGPGTGPGPSPAAREKDSHGNDQHSAHLPALHLDNNMVEGALIGLNVGMAGALLTGNNTFAPEAALIGAGVGAYIARNH